MGLCVDVLMKIVFDEIVKEIRFEEGVPAQELDLGYSYSAQVEPTVLSVTAAPIQGGVHLSGSFPYKATIPCSRCLGPASVEGEAHFSLNYYPDSAAPPAEEDQEVPLEETEDVFTDEGSVTPEALVAQQLYLELPEKVLCRDDCRGLCPRCGADLNPGPCPCPPGGDPRWVGLLDLKNRKEE